MPLITQTSEYALRAAVFLGSRPSNDPASAQDISNAIRVPVGYLQKILRVLARHGLLTTRRGSGGGFALAKLPSAISVLDILTAADGPIGRIEQCPLGISGHTRLCSLHRLIDTEISRTEQVFARTSLADLIDDTDGVRPLCPIDAPKGAELRFSARSRNPNRDESTS